jgi:hypothetical protein
VIEREKRIKIYSQMLGPTGQKGMNGQLVRVADGFYEVLLELNERHYTTLLPIGATVIMSMEPEEQVAAIQVER